MNGRNLFLVQSPLQLLAAAEATRRFPARENVLVLRDVLSKTRNAALLRRLTGLTPWTRIEDRPSYERPYGRLNFFADALLAARLRREGFTRAFYGDFAAFELRFLAQNAGAPEVYLIDDGMATWVVHDRLETLGWFHRREAERTVRLKKALARLAGMPVDDAPPRNYFTCFPLAARPGETVVENDFALLRSTLGPRPVSAEVVFLGQPLPEQGFLSEDRFLAVVAQARAAYPGEPFTYAPHRDESAAKLARIAALGVRVETFDDIVEVALGRRPALPRAVLGAFSSALVSLPKIYPACAFAAFEVEAAALGAAHRERVVAVYGMLKGLPGLRVVPPAP